MTIIDAPACIIQLLRGISAINASIDIISDRNNSAQEGINLLTTLQVTQGHVWDSIRHIQLRGQLIVYNSSLSPKHTIRSEPRSLSVLSACQHLNLDSLQSLWTGSVSMDLMALLSPLTQFHTLTLQLSRCFQGFVVFMQRDDLSKQGTVSFPALRELRLVELDSGEGLGGLYDVLAARNVWGCGLKRLEFVECDGVGIGDVVRLRKVVDNVVLSDKSIADLDF
ncbi:hypothetical protein BDN72DRAFT_679488 [Pluteus cervinus]|uniref:Uncharacterized protein n=1 Tax=Pluteus cervinus TaxID=181527 RepID=A0ACD2ZZR9_9AGAR|nr:hypothetical protein BDN72DRAFT_679488 [Pluteus cervinus]